jgi:hypothetical protein
MLDDIREQRDRWQQQAERLAMQTIREQSERTGVSSAPHGRIAGIGSRFL